MFFANKFLPFVRNRLAVEIHLHYLKSSVYLLNPKVSGCQQHYEIHKPPSDICWNLEDPHFPKPRTLEVPASWSLDLAWSLGSTRKSLLMIKGITISMTKFLRTACSGIGFAVGLLKFSIKKMVNHTNDHYSLLYDKVRRRIFDSMIDQEYDYYNMNEMFIYWVPTFSRKIASRLVVFNKERTIYDVEHRQWFWIFHLRDYRLVTEPQLNYCSTVIGTWLTENVNYQHADTLLNKFWIFSVFLGQYLIVIDSCDAVPNLLSFPPRTNGSRNEPILKKSRGFSFVLDVLCFYISSYLIARVEWYVLLLML